MAKRLDINYGIKGEKAKGTDFTKVRENHIIKLLRYTFFTNFNCGNKGTNIFEGKGS